MPNNNQQQVNQHFGGPIGGQQQQQQQLFPPPGRLQQPTTTSVWFVGAPVTKLYVIGSIVFYLLIHNSVIGNNQRTAQLLSFDGITIYQNNNTTEFYRYITSKLLFGSVSDMLIGLSFVSFLLQKYERELSSRKFILFLMTTTVLSIIIEYSILSIVPSFYLIHYSGPYVVLGSIVTLFHIYSPRLQPRLVSLGNNTIYFSEKAFYYIWFMYIILSTSNNNNHNNLTSSSSTSMHTETITTSIWDTIAPTMVGILAAIVYINVPQLQQLDVPDWIVRIVQPVVNRFLFDTSHPAMVVPFHPSSSFQHPTAAAIMTAAFGSGFDGGYGNNNNNNNYNTTPLFPIPPPPQPHHNPRGAGGGFLQNRRQRNQQHHHSTTTTNNNETNNNNDGWEQQQQQQIPQHPGTASESFTIPPSLLFVEPDPVAIEQLVAMGFPEEQVRDALRQTQNHVEHAADRLLSSM